MDEKSERKNRLVKSSKKLSKSVFGKQYFHESPETNNNHRELVPTIGSTHGNESLSEYISMGHRIRHWFSAGRVRKSIQDL